MSLPLSPYRLGKAREIYNIFNIFNSLSWNFLVGSVITLFALRLGASSTYIGILNALLYVAFFFLPLGKFLARRFKIVSIFSFAWVARAVGMVPAVFAPFAAYFGHYDLALNLTLLGVALFHITRGVGMIANNPVLGNLSAGPDRGSYMTQVQIINSATGMFSGFAIALALGQEKPSLFLYSIITVIGIICGITSGLLIKKVPEPSVEEKTEKISLTQIFREAFSAPAIKLFVIILLMVALVSGVSRTFLVVYAREALSQTDGLVSLYSVFGGLGNLMVGMLIKFLVDRIGAKPIFILCVITGMVTMIFIVFFPSSAVGNLATVFLFLSFLFFMLNFGFLGSEGIAQTYFMGLVPPEKMLNMGIVYFLIFGIAGAGGSLLAGLVLDMFSLLGFSHIASYKILYAILIVLAAIIVLLQRKLTPLGALSLAGAVKIMFSYRDLQAISLLDRLDKTHNSRQEEQLLGALHYKPSQLATKGLLERARSPRLATRLESISALERLETLNGDAEKALINDISANPFTTAYISARILGNHGCSTAIPLLRELAFSGDYMLAGEAMIALAKLRDEAFRPQIEKIIHNTRNPRLNIMGTEALGLYCSPHSLCALIDIFYGENPPPYLCDEVAIAMSAIVDTQQQFYRLLVRFLAEPSIIPVLAMDEAEAAYEFFSSNLGGRKGAKKKNGLPILSQKASNIQAAVSSMAHDNDPVPLSRWILELPTASFSKIPAFGIAQAVFPEILLDAEMSAYKGLHLLIIHWAAYQIRNWTKIIRN
ncbi:MAG: MFS transporter [Treponema sp.]|jgi:MFS family permease|nr:MFS transporter [Treponema sp.]